jgi:hypothetical protein
MLADWLRRVRDFYDDVDAFAGRWRLPFWLAFALRCLMKFGFWPPCDIPPPLDPYPLGVDPQAPHSLQFPFLPYGWRRMSEVPAGEFVLPPELYGRYIEYRANLLKNAKRMEDVWRLRNPRFERWGVPTYHYLYDHWIAAFEQFSRGAAFHFFVTAMDTHSALPPGDQMQHTGELAAMLTQSEVNLAKKDETLDQIMK